MATADFGRLTDRTKRGIFCIAALGLSAAAHAAAQTALPAPLAAAVAAANVAAGLCVALLAPGMLYVPLWRRLNWIPRQSRVFYPLVAAGLSSAACHVASHKLVVLSGYMAEYWSMWAGAAAFAALGAVLSSRWGHTQEAKAPPAVTPQTGLVQFASVVGAGALIVFVLAASPPRFVEEINYWPDKTYADLSKLNFGHIDLAGAGIETTYGLEWDARREGVYDLAGIAGTLRIVNRGDVAYPLDLKFVLQNRWQEGIIARFQLDGTAIGERELFHYVQDRFRHSITEPADFVRLWPVFDHTRDPRDRPMHLCLVAPTISVAPGEHVLRMQFETESPYDGAGPRITLFDMSNLTSEQFYRKLTRHFFIADTGDLYETLDFSRNFKQHWIQHSSSYQGGRLDGGGPTSISDEPPGHHFLCFLALTFVRDSITSISALYLVELLLLFFLVVHLAAWDNEGFRWWHVLPIVGVFCAYSRLCRLGVESNAPDTLFLLVWLCVMKAYMDRRQGLAVWLVGVAFLIHIPAPHALVFLGAAAWLVTREREGLKFICKALMLLAVISVARVMIISMEAGLRGALASGQAPFGGVQRMELLKEILLKRRWSRAFDLLMVAKDFARLVLVATCGAVPIYAVSLFVRVRRRGRDMKAGVLFLFGLFYYLAMSLVDFQRGHHVGPIALPLMAALVRRVSQTDGPAARRILFGVTIAACLAAIVFLLVAGPDYTGTFTRFPLTALTHASNRRGYGFHPF